jgi:hypothetical protein
MGRAWITSKSGETIARVDRLIYIHWRDLEPGELIAWFRYCNGGRGLPPEGA